jgi:hypothetical protein
MCNVGLVGTLHQHDMMATEEFPLWIPQVELEKITLIAVFNSVNRRLNQNGVDLHIYKVRLCMQLI